MSIQTGDMMELSVDVIILVAKIAVAGMFIPFLLENVTQIKNYAPSFDAVGATGSSLLKGLFLG